MGDFSGESLRFAIEQSGVSKSELARRLNITPAAINTYIRTKQPSMEIWNKIFVALGREPLKVYNTTDSKMTIVREEESHYYGGKRVSLADELGKLSELFKAHLLTEAEFVEAKKLILDKYKNK